MLSGHSRASFSRITNISAATLRAWEEPTDGRHGLTEKGAQRLIDGLHKCDVRCTMEWLFFGKGFGLSIKNNELKPHDLDFEVIAWGEEESILKDIAAFKANNPNAIVVMVNDEAMLPFFSQGDYAGGCKANNTHIKQLIGKNCIIDTGEELLIRKITACHKNRYTVVSINPNIAKPTVLSVQIKAAAEITWHRWKRKL